MFKVGVACKDARERSTLDVLAAMPEGKIKKAIPVTGCGGL
jgi:hypothetical protein